MSFNFDQTIKPSEFAELIGLSERRVYQLSEAGTIDIDDDGNIDLKDAIKRYTAQQRKGGVNPLYDEESGLTFDNYTQRKAYYDSEAKKDEILEKRKHLFPAETVQECFFNLVEQARESFLILPDIIERDTGADPKVVADIEKNIDKILNGLANEGERVRRELGVTS